MIFHFGFEIPKPVVTVLDAEAPGLTEEEIRILRTQIRKNAVLVDEYIRRLDLLVNQEKYPHQEIFIQKIRNRLFLLMEENDTFRNTLWKNEQCVDRAGRVNKVP